MGKLIGIQHINEAMVDEVKLFPLPLLPRSLENTMFYEIQQKEWKRYLIQISRMVEDGEMIKIEYLKMIVQCNVCHNSIAYDILGLRKVFPGKPTTHMHRFLIKFDEFLWLVSLFMLSFLCQFFPH